jgi:CubicO group peptidase (beta-lactamase class C family)
VARDGEIVSLEAVGKADMESGRPMAADSMFCIASMTKPIVATATLILQDEGRLSIDDPVSQYLPAFGDAALRDEAASRQVTIRDLLTHTSGLTGSQEVTGSLAETADELARRPLAFQPGSRWAYSPGLNVCGRVVEVLSGKSLDAFLADRLFRPLGMNDTTFDPAGDQRSRLVTLYRPGEAPGTLRPTSHWLTDFENHPPNPSGGLFSTARDMYRFYQMILDGGQLDGERVVSRDAVGQMTALQTAELRTGFTDGNGWGLGWCVVRQPQGVTAMLSPGTFGHGGAFGTQGWVDPVRDMICVLMIQRTGFGNSDGSEIRLRFQKLAVSEFGD